MKESLQQILEEAKKRLQEVTSIQEAEEVRVKVLGKKGQITSILKTMGSLYPEERKELGMEANKTK
ncbi:MAG: phenylalanine--tRNA ligase subunit alpha, partial [Firmicutes bacterium]|nr:phenylalanine--tRNA ligase subunit alpha [Bacillota bacterium]